MRLFRGVVLPIIQVHRWQRFARQKWIVFGYLDESVRLHVLNAVAIVAEKSRETGFSDFAQLFWKKGKETVSLTRTRLFRDSFES